jgi:hypothetical protein
VLDAVDDVDVVVVLGGGDDVTEVDVDGGARDGVVVAVLDASPPAEQPATSSAPAAHHQALRIGRPLRPARLAWWPSSLVGGVASGPGGSPGRRAMGAA